MDIQEPGAQSESDVHRDQATNANVATQGVNPDKAANPDEAAIPDKESIPDDSTPDQVATQEPLTQSVKEGQATQEPPTQRAGESLTEEPILIQPLKSIPHDSVGSGTMTHSTSITTEISARMTTSGPSQEEPPTGMTSENFSLPPLVSS